MRKIIFLLLLGLFADSIGFAQGLPPLPPSPGGSLPPSPGGSGKLGGGSVNSMEPPGGGEGGGDTNEYVFLYSAPPGLKFTNIVLSGGTIGVTLREHEPYSAYDIYFRTNAAGLRGWHRILEGAPGQTNFTLPVLTTDTGFFVIGSTLDTDGDGLPDAYEELVTGSNRLLFDTNGNGISDGNEDSDANGLPDWLDYVRSTRAAVYTSRTNAVEGGTYGEFTFVLPVVATTNTTVQFHVGANADIGSDFVLTNTSGTSFSNTVVFAPGTWFQQVRVVAVDNDVQETRPRRVTVTLTNFPGGVFDTGIASVDLTDNDKPMVSVNAIDPDAVEPSPAGTNTALVRISRDGINTNSLAVLLTLTGNATSSVDYATWSTTATIPANSNSLDLVLSPLTNSIYQGMRTAIVSIAQNAAYIIKTNQGVANVFITDDDRPVVELQGVDLDLRETGLKPGKFGIIRSGPLREPLTVTVNYGGNATNGVDVSFLTNVFVIPANSNRVEITVTPVADGIAEMIETFAVTLGGSLDYAIGTSNRVTFYLNDGGSTVYDWNQIKQGSVYHTVGTNLIDSPVVIEVWRTGPALTPTNFLISVQSNTTFVSGYVRFYGDITNAPTGPFLQFKSNQSKAFIYATSAQQGKTNGGANLSMTNLFGSGGKPIYFQPADRYVKLSVTQTNGVEGSSTVQFQAQRYATGTVVSFNFNLRGTATPNADFTSPSTSATSLSLAANALTATMTITPVQDSQYEAWETIIADTTDSLMSINPVLDVSDGYLTFIRDNVSDPSTLAQTDSDGDGLSDFWEIQYGLNPLVPDDVSRDDDRDGLSLREEFLAGTSPLTGDTDGDGVSDFFEVNRPLEEDDNYLRIRLRVGDSGKHNNGANCAVCHTTDLRVGPWRLNTPPRTNANYFGAEKLFSFKKGTNYPISVLEFVQNLPRPNSLSTSPSTTARYTAQVLPESDSFPAQFVVEDPGNRLGSNLVWTTSFPTPNSNPIGTLIVPRIDITFTNVNGNTPLDANPNWGGGLRVFPDQLNPTDTTARNTVRVVVRTTPALPGKQVRLRVIDVDDPSPDERDKNNYPILDFNDLNGEQGNDNRGTNAILISSLLTLDSQGSAETTITIPMQPGDNLRIAGLLEGINAQDVLGYLQVTNKAEYLYVGPTNVVRRFMGGVSPMLTIWRKLNLEFDSMTAPPATSSAAELNRIEGTIAVAEPNFPTSGKTTLRVLCSYPSDRSSFNCKNGRVDLGAYGSFKIVRHDNQYQPGWPYDRFVVDGVVPSLPAAHLFIAYDDDDQYLTNNSLYQSLLTLPAPLPTNGRSGEFVTNMQFLFTNAYVQLVDSNAKGWNSQQTVGFARHDTALIAPFNGILDQGNLQLKGTDRSGFWAYSIGLAYQPSGSEDGDPDEEIPSKGINPKYPATFTAGGLAVVYLECVREEAFENGRPNQFPRSYFNSSSRTNEIRNAYMGWTYGTMAHELGHAPGKKPAEFLFNIVGNDHGEGGLMQPGAADLRSVGFSLTTIRRFRSALSWAE